MYRWLGLSKLSSLLATIICTKVVVGDFTKRKVKVNTGRYPWHGPHGRELYKPKQYQHIAGGSPADGEDYPFFALLFGSLTNDDFYFCGGSLIKEDVVLTAAHCIDPFFPPARVRIGGTTNVEGESIEVTTALVHPEYNPTNAFAYDFALLFLASESSATPVNLNTDTEFPESAGTPLKTIGYGRTEDGTQSTFLKQLDLVYVEFDTCQATYFPDIQEPLHECVDGAEPLEAPCAGDSGGPLLYDENIAIGVLSFGAPCAGGSFGVDVYAKISDNYAWIANNAGLTDTLFPTETPPTEMPTPTTSLPIDPELGCSEAIPLEVPASVTDTTRGAQAYNGTDLTCGTAFGVDSPGLWYSVVGDGSDIQADLCSLQGFDTQMSVWTGECSDLECVGGNDDFCGLQSSVTFSTEPDQIYLIYVYGFAGSVGAFELTVTSATPAPTFAPTTAAPTPTTGLPIDPEVGCSDAVQLELPSSTFDSTVGAQAYVGDTLACGSASGVDSPGLWYSVTGDGSEISVDLCTDTFFDTQLSVWTGECSDLECVGGNDDFCGLQSRVSFSSSPGQTYLIYVYGFAGLTGEFTLTVGSGTSTDPPTGDPGQPTIEPTSEPTEEPGSTDEPTAEPTEEPTAEPTQEPTSEPTQEPDTLAPTFGPLPQTSSSCSFQALWPGDIFECLGP